MLSPKDYIKSVMRELEALEFPELLANKFQVEGLARAISVSCEKCYSLGKSYRFCALYIFGHANSVYQALIAAEILNMIFERRAVENDTIH